MDVPTPPETELTAPHAATPFPYMRFARAHLSDRRVPNNLGFSGTQPPTDAECTDLGLTPLSEIGDAIPALKATLAARYGVATDQVHLTSGSSQANFLAYFALARGGMVVAEEPTYEALHKLAGAVDARLAAVPRDPDRGWRLDLDALAAAVTPATDLIAVTDLHNPSGKRLHDDDYAFLEEIATANDALVLVDEVYAEFDDPVRPSAAARGWRFVAANSLTKVHGLNDLRCGWLLAAPAVIRRIAEVDDLICPNPPTLPLAQATRYLAAAEPRVARIRTAAATRRAQVARWVEATPGVTWVEPDGGITGFLHVGGEDGGDRVAQYAHDVHGVMVVPGSYFQRPGWIRISYGVSEETLATCLDAISQALLQ